MIKLLLTSDAKAIHLNFATVTPSEVSFDAVSFVYSKTFFLSSECPSVLFPTTQSSKILLTILWKKAALKRMNF